MDSIGSVGKIIWKENCFVINALVTILEQDTRAGDSSQELCTLCRETIESLWIVMLPRHLPLLLLPGLALVDVDYFWQVGLTKNQVSFVGHTLYGYLSFLSLLHVQILTSNFLHVNCLEQSQFAIWCIQQFIFLCKTKCDFQMHHQHLPHQLSSTMGVC